MLKQKNKIFFVITSLDYGGTQKQLFYLIKHFPLSNYIPVVISLKENGRFVSKITQVCDYVYNLGLPLKVSVATVFLFPIAFVKFLILCLKHKPKIVHSFLFQANIITRLTKIFLWKTKIICSERVAEKRKLWQHKVLMLTNFLVDKIVVNSQKLKSFVIQYQKVPHEKIVVIPNMIEIQETIPKLSSEELRKKLGINRDIFIICSAGRLHKQKGYDLLIEIVKELLSEFDKNNIKKNFVVIIIGDGVEYNNLLSYAKKLGVDDYIKFLGYKENVYDYINMSDLVVITSYWEGSPNIVLEALVLGKPVISTSVEGVDEILDNRFIVSLNQEREKIIQEFKQKIVEIYNKRHLLAYPTKVNLEMYNPEVIVKRFLSLYC